ncbi:hypothetical protein IU11_18750 [Cellulosimicrobium sp. MM]|nr:hypothetical protein [Cellulosimicrobium sp. MM]KFD42681.1 hypothetical protein IU11_18750 [Cellulosimicrobium sp. MM]
MLDQQEVPPGGPPGGGRARTRRRRASGRATSTADVFAAALLVAVGGLVYELILGTAASYLFGDSVVAFSVATGSRCSAWASARSSRRVCSAPRG